MAHLITCKCDIVLKPPKCMGESSMISEWEVVNGWIHCPFCCRRIEKIKNCGECTLCTVGEISGTK